MLSSSSKLFDTYVTVLTFSDDGKLLAVGSREQRVKVVEVATGKTLAEINPPGIRWGWIRALRFSEDNNMLFAGGDDRILRVWEVESKTEVAAIKGHPGVITGIYALPNQQFITWDSQREVRVWQWEDPNLELLGEYRSSQQIGSVTLTAKGETILAGWGSPRCLPSLYRL
jgi:WD40 repeat protein